MNKLSIYVSLFKLELHFNNYISDLSYGIIIS